MADKKTTELIYAEIAERGSWLDDLAIRFDRFCRQHEVTQQERKRLILVMGKARVTNALDALALVRQKAKRKSPSSGRSAPFRNAPICRITGGGTPSSSAASWCASRGPILR